MYITLKKGHSIPAIIQELTSLNASLIQSKSGDKGLCRWANLHPLTQSIFSKAQFENLAITPEQSKNVEFLSDGDARIYPNRDKKFAILVPKNDVSKERPRLITPLTKITVEQIKDFDVYSIAKVELEVFSKFTAQEAAIKNALNT